jgi:hypothetical protein
VINGNRCCCLLDRDDNVNLSRSTWLASAMRSHSQKENLYVVRLIIISRLATSSSSTMRRHSVLHPIPVALLEVLHAFMREMKGRVETRQVWNPQEQFVWTSSGSRTHSNPIPNILSIFKLHAEKAGKVHHTQLIRHFFISHLRSSSITCFVLPSQDDGGLFIE